MDPLSIGLGIAGFATSLFGGMSASGDAKAAANINKQIAGDEQQINDQKRQQMDLEASRNSLQIFRNIQRQRSLGLANAVSQGAQFGSGTAGGQSSVTNEGMFNAQGVNQNLQFGNTIFGINQNISGLKMDLANVQSAQASDQSLMSLGNAMVGASGTIGKLGSTAVGAFKSANVGNYFMGGGSPSGYGNG